MTDDAERLAIAAGVIVRHAAPQGVPDVVITGGAAVAILTQEDFGYAGHRRHHRVRR